MFSAAIFKIVSLLCPTYPHVHVCDLSFPGTPLRGGKAFILCGLGGGMCICCGENKVTYWGGGCVGGGMLLVYTRSWS